MTRMLKINRKGFQMKKFIAVLGAVLVAGLFATGALAQTVMQTIKSDVRAAKVEVKSAARAVKANVKSGAKKVKRGAKKATAKVKAKSREVKAEVREERAEARAR